MTTSAKTCSDCSETKPLTEYYSKGKSKTTDKIYYEAYCKCCSIARAVIRGAAKIPTDEQKARRAEWISAHNKRLRQEPDTRHVALWKDYRGADRKKGRDNDLTKDFVKDMLTLECLYCGDTENMSLDRIDNALGHLQSNVNPSCMRCNLVRGDMPYAAWLMVAPAMRAAREAGAFEEWSPKRR